jgi:hypothetical protein
MVFEFEGLNLNYICEAPCSILDCSQSLSLCFTVKQIKVKLPQYRHAGVKGRGSTASTPSWSGH